MPRDRSADKVVRFPKGEGLRLEHAIDAFDRGVRTVELVDQFRDLIARGLSEAHFFLGCLYEAGYNGKPADMRAALAEYKSSIDEFGYVEGYLAAARLLYHGHGVGQDLRAAFRYYSHVASRHTHPVAAFMLGRMYHRGEGVNADLVEARRWYEKSIARGSVYGMLNLAMLEYDLGHYLKALVLRFKAGLMAFAIALRDRRDMRLRGG